MVVLERDSWWVRVAPLTTDVALADEYTFVADENSTTLRHPTGIFLRAAATVPMYTFARFLGDVGTAGSDDVGESLRRLEASCIRQAAPPDGLTTGSRLEPDDWDRLEALDALHDQMRWFESATRGVVDKSGLIVGRDGEIESSPDAVDASELLKRPGGTLGEVMAATHIEAVRLQALKTGRAKPTRDERAVLEQYFGVPVKTAHPPKKRLALLEVLSRPSHRDDWLEWQQQIDALDVEVEDALVPFMEHMLEASPAMRSGVTRSVQPEEEWSLDEWRRWWEERFALRRK
ncbi:hypothetical protein [Kribbella sindirgiensis]|uniref:Uncharacterized protein n=1 Tax=Kribbella sindirgiensis TaxID=1124744 RepID=A0A4V2M333_9ACTN|nr:hypothetical protein [Kribbella sindirgiensis]TCC30512.1 hypothetical protein E0H50_24195 [Kribbella sindirgiensis]